MEKKKVHPPSSQEGEEEGGLFFPMKQVSVDVCT